MKLAPECAIRARPIVLVAVLWAAVAIPSAVGQDPNPLLPDSVMGGWKVFARKQCIECHAVWGLGGQVGPDLGRAKQENLTAGILAGTMWNHIPKMHSHMLRKHLEYPRLTQKEMSDLFSFLFFMRYLDEPGDPDAGQRTLREKGCVRCHAIEGRLQQAAPDLKRWAGYANPIVWAQKMWEHAPKMQQAMQEAGVTWPELAGSDLVNIMAYVRSVAGHEVKVYLQPGSARTGARLFADRKCRSCHTPGGAGKDLATTVLPRSLAALASRMWNHSPEMTRMMQAQGVKRSPLTAQEMADIIAYIISLRYEGRGGDVQRGRAVFQEKQCAQCHTEEKTAAAAPAIEALGNAASPVRLAYAMWNHGLTMMDRMSDSGIVWPVFQGGEVVDLIAYLRSTAPPQKAAARAAPEPAPPSEASPSVALPPIKADASCVTSACHPGIVAGRVIHGPAAQGECDTCHTLVNPQAHQFKLLSKSSDLCYTCHDEPVETMQVHGPVAVGVCIACHDPHSAENLFGPNFTGNEMCFADMIGMTAALETLVPAEPLSKSESIEKPTEKLTAEPTEKPTEKPTAEPTTKPQATPAIPRPDAPSPATSSTSTPPVDVVAPVPSIPIPATLQGGCVTSQCHSDIVSSPFVHGPVAQQECELCHAPIDKQNHRFELTVKEPDLCYECHDRPAEEAKFEHGPVAVGMCTACHSPHGAPNKFMLLEAGSELCFMCHTEMGDHVHNARVQHKVIAEKGCTACHDPHRGNIQFLLTKDVSELCLDCHQPIREIIDTAVIRHQPVTTEKKCVNCHNPHGSDVPKILADVQMNLCLGCHNKPMDTPNGPIIDMKSWVENNPEHHGPIRDGNCTGCHEPHGSKNFRILQHAFPHKFYSPFSVETYALCFECHEETIVLDERTTTLTGFRNGDKNLHYVHVNQKKGRTCRACHEVHAGTKPKRIKDFVPFGNWKYPVNFEKTEHGGRCAPGCHVERAYDVRKEIIQE